MAATGHGSEHFGPYRLLRRLGRGGMGEVWVAFDTRREREVALKRMVAALAADPVFAERFRREARLTARLSSPHIIPIHDFGEIDGVLFLDMRLVPGTDLSQLIGSPLSPQRTLEIAGQVAGALDTAHAAGLLHRDVKPSNVLVETDPRGVDSCYLVDFGIAKLTRDAGPSPTLTATGAMIGTPAYLAPEAFAGADGATARSDVYALGCVVFEMLTGTRPFTAREPAALLYQHTHQAPPRPSALRPGLERYDAVLAAALAKVPTQRPASAGELVDALAGAADGPRSPGSPRSWTTAPGLPTERPDDPAGRTDPSVPTAAPVTRTVNRRLAVAVAALLAVVAIAVVATLTLPLTTPASSAPSPPDAPYDPADPEAVPARMDPSGAPVRHLTAHDATVVLSADESLDLDSVAHDWGVAPIASDDVVGPDGPLGDVAPGRYDVFYRSHLAALGPTLEGFRLTDRKSYGATDNFITCRSAMDEPDTQPVTRAGLSRTGDTFCVQSDQGRYALLRVADATPDRLLLQILVWEPTG